MDSLRFGTYRICRMDNAFKFDEKSGGLCSEADYPYMAKQGKTCMTNCTDVPGTIVKTFIDVPPGKTDALVAAVTLQPISVAIQANQFVFQFYKSGVITDDKCGARGDIDHGVLGMWLVFHLLHDCGRLSYP